MSNILRISTFTAKAILEELDTKEQKEKAIENWNFYDDEPNAYNELTEYIKYLEK